MMPDVDGHALVRTLRASPQTDFLPIILLTAHTGMDQRLQGLEGGADDYLTKPFDTRESSVRIENLIAQRRRLQERSLLAPRPFPLPPQWQQTRRFPRPTRHSWRRWRRRSRGTSQIRSSE